MRLACRVVRLLANLKCQTMSLMTTAARAREGAAGTSWRCIGKATEDNWHKPSVFPVTLPLIPSFVVELFSDDF